MAFFYKKQKHIYIEAEVDRHFASGDARAYQFIHQFKPIADQIFTGELSEVTRVLYCQKSIFIIGKNDYSKASAVESNLLSCVQIKRELEEFYSRFSGVGANTKGKVLQSVSHTACLGMIYN